MLAEAPPCPAPVCASLRSFLSQPSRGSGGIIRRRCAHCASSFARRAEASPPTASPCLVWAIAKLAKLPTEPRTTTVRSILITSHLRCCMSGLEPLQTGRMRLPQWFGTPTATAAALRSQHRLWRVWRRSKCRALADSHRANGATTWHGQAGSIIECPEFAISSGSNRGRWSSLLLVRSAAALGPSPLRHLEPFAAALASLQSALVRLGTCPCSAQPRGD